MRIFEGRIRILEIGKRPLEQTFPCWRFPNLEFLLMSHTWVRYL